MSESPPIEKQAPSTQMELLDDRLLPERPDIEEMVRARSFVPAPGDRRKVFTHSGKIVVARLVNDEALAEAVCTALVIGMSARLIAKRFSMSPRSVVRIREAMTERGELAPVRQRIQQKLDRVIEDGLDRWHEGIVNGEIHPGQLPIATLAAVDKRGQLEAGIVPGTERTVGEVTLEQVLAAKRLASESASVAEPGKSLNRKAATVVDTNPATNPPGGPPPVIDLATPSPAPPAGHAVPAEGGGGESPAPAGYEGRWDGPENSKS